MDQTLLEILSRYVSPINARGFLDRALRTGAVSGQAAQLEQLPHIIQRLTPSLKLFLDSATLAAVLEEMNRLGQPSPAVARPTRVDVQREEDLLGLRKCAREHCVTADASSFATMRVLTVVSELGRNIVNYSKGGWIDLQLLEKRIQVTAEDRGPGIANLDEILAGKYHSRSGLGLGIIGAKRLAQEFSIETGTWGTRVRATIVL
jgi:serine/threonine-protein kinase RsbT